MLYPYSCFSVFLHPGEIENVVESISRLIASNFNALPSVVSVSMDGGGNEALQKASILDYKGIIYKQKDGMAIYLDNTGDGYPALITQLGGTTLTEIVHCRLFPEGRFRGFFMHYYSNNVTRIIQSYDDGGKWVFHQAGIVQPFEDESNYQRRNVREKFNEIIALKYLLNLGIDIASPDFWAPRGAGWEIKR